MERARAPGYSAGRVTSAFLAAGYCAAWRISEWMRCFYAPLTTGPRTRSSLVDFAQVLGNR